MHRIDGTGATTSLPTPSAVGSTVGYFTAGNPGAGAPATVVTVDWANAVQEELVSAITENNGSMDKTTQTGLREALKHIANNRPNLLQNLSLGTSVSASAMTISLKDRGGSSLSATNIARIAFRNSTATTGNFNVRNIIANLSLIIPSGATLGSESAVPDYLYVWVIDTDSINSGTTELAVSGANFNPESGIASSTAIGAGSTSRSVLYSTTARTNLPVRLLGRLLYTQTTAGTWASVGTTLELEGQGPKLDIETGSFTALFNQSAGAGGSGNSFTVNFMRIGKLVTLVFPGMQAMTAGATASSFGTASGTIPARLRPTNSYGVVVIGHVNGVDTTVPSQISVQSSGIIQIQRDLLGSATYTSGQVSGIYPMSMTYTVQ